MASSPSHVLGDPNRLTTLRRVDALVGPAAAAFDRLAASAAAAVGAPVGLVNLVDCERQLVKGYAGLGEPYASTRELPTAWGLCPFTMALGEPLLLDDIGAEPQCAANPIHTKLGFAAYAGIPLEVDGQTIGTLCVLDVRPRSWTDRDREVLEALAAAVMTEIELRVDIDRRERLLDAFEDAPVAVAITRGPDHVGEYVNPAISLLFGARPLGTPGREAFPEPEARDFFAVMDRVYATGEACVLEEVPIRYDRDGEGAAEERFFAISFSAIRASAGGTYGLLVVAVDVTAQVTARREADRQRARLELLYRVTAALDAGIEPEAQLRALADAVVPELADACCIYLLDHPSPARVDEHEGIPVTRVAFAQDRRLSAPLPTPVGGLRPRPGAPLTDAVLRAAPAVVTGLSSARPAWSAEFGVAGWYEANRPHTLAAFPVQADAEVVGVVLFVACPGRPAFTEEDLTFLAEVTARSGAAVERGLRYQRVHEVALALQLSLLTDPPRRDDLDVAARYRPAQDGVRVGGDWYDAFDLPGGDLAVVIGDVAGHDITAAATMAQLRSMVRTLACDTCAAPSEVLARLDRLAHTLGITDLTTLILGRIARDPDGEVRLSWATAGHPPLLLVHPDGTACVLDSVRGVVIGTDADLPRSGAVQALPAGATLVLFTDGLIETRTGPFDRDLAHLVGCAGAAAHLPLGEFCDRLLEASLADTGDDVALLAVRVPRSPSAFPGQVSELRRAPAGLSRPWGSAGIGSVPSRTPPP